MKNVVFGDHILSLETLCFEQRRELTGEPALKITGRIHSENSTFVPGRETLITVHGYFDTKGSLRATRPVYKHRLWTAELANAISAFLVKHMEELSDVYADIAQRFIDSVENDLLRRKVEDFIRKNPERVQDVAQYLGI